MNKLTITRAAVRASTGLVRIANSIKAHAKEIHIDALYAAVDRAWTLWQDKRQAVKDAKDALSWADIEAEVAGAAADTLEAVVEQEVANLQGRA
jgi:hypothetical protein